VAGEWRARRLIKEHEAAHLAQLRLRHGIDHLHGRRRRFLARRHLAPPAPAAAATPLPTRLCFGSVCVFDRPDSQSSPAPRLLRPLLLLSLLHARPIVRQQQLVILLGRARQVLRHHRRWLLSPARAQLPRPSYPVNAHLFLFLLLLLDTSLCNPAASINTT
jgi:hypothetical protein